MFFTRPLAHKITLSALTLLCLVGCSSSPTLSRLVIQEPNRLVKLYVAYREGGKEHSHPAIVARDDVAAVLRSITVSPHGVFSERLRASTEKEQAFTEEQIQFFANYFAKAFAQATPLEEILFFWSQTRDHNLREITSGSCYMEGEELHLVVSSYRQVISGKVREDRAREDPLTVLGEPLYDLHPGNLGQTRDQGLWAHFFSSQPQHLIMSYAQEALSKNQLKRKSSPMQTPVGYEEGSLEQRLERLKNVFQAELITQEEYQRKKREILDQF